MSGSTGQKIFGMMKTQGSKGGSSGSRIGKGIFVGALSVYGTPSSYGMYKALGEFGKGSSGGSWRGSGGGKIDTLDFFFRGIGGFFAFLERSPSESFCLLRIDAIVS